MKHKLLLVLPAAILLILLLLVACTGATGTISGVVIGSGPIEKATVTTEPATASVTTDKDGKYTINNVPPGSYLVIASAAGRNSAASKVSVSVGKGATAKFVLVPAEPFPLGSVRAVSASAGDKEVFPNKQVAITLTAGYGTSNNNLISTSGLNNVPVGTFVYLQGKETDASGAKITSWSWKVSGPREKTVTVENASTRLPRFKAEEEGRYEVTINVTNDKGAKASSSFEVNSGRYVGVANCATCHSGNVMADKITEWKETGHGDKFQSTFARYNEKSDYCLRCHNVGLDESSKAGGFADAAKQVGWNPEKGSIAAWLAANKMTVDQVMNSPMGEFANVQCESCHGPGSVHEGIINTVEIGTLYNPGVCSQCHGQELQWRNSGHAITGSNNLHTAEGASCVACHTGQGFVAVTVRGEDPVFPNMAREGLEANIPDAGNMSPIACATCHDPHAFSEPHNKGTDAAPNIASLQLRMEGEVTMPNGVTVDAKASASCVSCHADKRDLAYKADYLAGKTSRGAHDDTQADVFYGVTPAVFDFGGTQYASSAHASVVKEACVECHMAANPAAPKGAQPDNKEVIVSHGVASLITAGGHSWNMEGTYQKQAIENIAACTDCHKDLTSFNRKAYADYDGNGKVDGIQDEVKGLLKIVEAQLPKDDQGKLKAVDKMTEVQRQAYWNYSVVKNDKSNGVHNTAFSVQVLQRSYKALTGKDVPGAKLR